MSEYVDSLLLSCNRKQSVEYLGGNTTNKSTWTNVVSNGVRLNVGDQVSVHSSAISEIGNESATIEIKGKNLGGFYNASHTTGGGEFTNASLGYYKTSYQQTDLKFPMRDDTLNFTYSFYKNTNGEYYYHLPRKGCWDASHNNFHTGGDGTTQNIWSDVNCSTNGSLAYPNPFRFNLDYRTNVIQQDFITGGVKFNRYEDDAFTTAPMNDGGRYTLFVRDSSFNSSDNGSISGHRDPALFNYLWYKQTKQIQVDSGFNSPLNIADRITNNLAETTTIDSVSIGENNNNPEQTNADIQVESETNKLFPVASGVNVEFTKARNYHDYTNPTGASWDYDYEAGYVTIGVKRPEIYETGCRINVYNAEGSASSIGAKNNVNNLGNDEFSSIDGSFSPFPIDITDGIAYPIENSVNGSYTNVFPLYIPWTDDMLKKLGDFFKAQGRYPELFQYDRYTPQQRNYIAENSSGNISAEKCRFIHMNASHNRNADDSDEWSGGVFFTSVVSGSSVINCSGKVAEGTFKIGDLLYMNSAGSKTIYFPKGTYIIGITGTIGASGSKITLNNVSLGSSSDDQNWYFTDRKLGNDNYDKTLYSSGATLNASQTAPAFFFDYNPSREGILDGEGESYDTLYDGFAVKVDNTHNVPNGSGNMSHLIGLRFGTHIKTMSPYWWRTSGLPPSIGSRMKNVRSLACGFDKHFNSFGNCFMNLYNGDACSWNQYYNSKENTSATLNESLSLAPEFFGLYLDRFNIVPRVTSPAYFDGNNAPLWNSTRIPSTYMRNEIYIGANDPEMTFSAGQSRFQLTRLHTPEFIGNLANANEGVADAQAIVYKINKRLNNNNWTPEMMPYDQQDFFSYARSGSHDDRKKAYSVLNLALAPYGICDSMSGIQIEDYGVDEKHWDDSLWGLMGFSYNQFHKTTNNRLVRMFDKGLTTDTPTTNAQISANEVNGYPRNGSDVPNFDSLETFPARWVRMPPFAHPNYGNTNLGGMLEFPTVVQNCSSTSITADNLPRKMLSPVFLIKSSLIDGSFIGGEESQMKMPVMSVVPKNSGYGDFYNGGGGETFTITYPKVITEIKTSIVDADGTESRVDDGSLVVYKVTKVMKSNSSVIEGILNPQPPEK
jgi:hypothetical protein